MDEEDEMANQTTAVVEVPNKEEENMLSPLANVYASRNVANQWGSPSPTQRRIARTLWVILAAAFIAPIVIGLVAFAVNSLR